MTKEEKELAKLNLLNRGHIKRTLALGTIVILGGGFVVYFVMRFLCSLWTWYGSEPLYRLFQFLKYTAPVIVVGIYILWLLVILHRESKKGQKAAIYLQEVINATKLIYDGKDNEILLSPELKNVEMQLNNIRFSVREKERQAREAEQRKNDLVVYLAHDLKTPLTSVIGYLTLLHDEQEISPQLREKYQGIALDKAEHLEDLINEFFEITRFNLTNLSLDLAKINLTRLLEQLVFEFQPMLSEKQLTGQLAAPKDLMITCDASKMERVLENLLRNAVNYSYEGGEVTVEAMQTAEYTEITVANRGMTIPPEKLERIFEQFYRLDSARTSRSGGAGLGLAIAKEIVELHGGNIEAKSEQEEIVFTVRLPLK